MSTIYSSQCLSSGLEYHFDPQGEKFIKSSSPCVTPWEESLTKVQYGSSISPPPSPTTESAFTPVPLQDMTNKTLDFITRGIKTVIQDRSSMIPIDEGLYKKLSSLFPSVQEDELRQLCKKNYNNELAIMGDLTARGYRPVYTPPASTRTGYIPTQGRYTTYTTSPSSVISTTLSSSTVSSTNSTLTSSTNVFSNNRTPALSSSSPPPSQPPVSNSTSALKSAIAATPGSAITGSTTTTANSRSNSPSTAFWGRRVFSPIPAKTILTSKPAVNPSSQDTVKDSSSVAQSTATGSPVPVGRCYYPGRFVQGVGFEAGSMGGSPRLTGRPFVPLQGRYSLSGMITEKGNLSSSHKSHFIHQPTPREPSQPQNYGSHSGVHHPLVQYGTTYPHHFPASTSAPLPHYSSTSYASHLTFSTPPLPSTQTPPTVSRTVHGPFPSWYGDEDRVITGSPQPAPRLYNVVHDALIKNKVTDRSSSPSVVIPARTSPVVYGSSSSPYRNSPERTPTPPHRYQQQQQLYPSHSSYSPVGGHFYATSSRLYTQSPKGHIRSDPCYGGELYGGGTSCTPPPPRSSSPQYHHYPASPRPQMGISQSHPVPPIVTHQQVPPPATSYVHPAYRTYSPIPAVSDALHSRSSPGPHSPKLKLRYLRRIYPGVDETFLLDVLANADNNVQIAMQELNTMGHVKVDTPPIRPASTVHATPPTEAKDTSRFKFSSDSERPVAPPRRLTEADKQKTRARMLEKVKGIPAAILTLALESVHFDEEKALVLLNKIKDEERNQGPTTLTTTGESDDRTKDGLALGDGALPSKIGSQNPPVVPARRSHKDHSTFPAATILGDSREVLMVSKGTCTQEDHVFQSRYKTESTGPNPNLRKGTNKDYYKADHARGSNPDNRKGPNNDIRLTSTKSTQNNDTESSKVLSTSKSHCNEHLAKGPKIEFNRGHQVTLVQGSTYKFP